MIRIRAVFAVGGLLLALAMLLAAACTGGSGGKSKTATPLQTGTQAAATTRTPAATGRTTQASPTDSTAAPRGTSVRNLVSITPAPTAFGERAAGKASDALRQLRSDLIDLRKTEHDLRDKVTVHGEPTPTLVPPLSQDWFNVCCRREMADIVRYLHDLDRGSQALSATYAGVGHTQGTAAADQINAQLGALHHALDAVSTAPTRADAVASLDDVDAAMTALRDTIQSALNCCVFAYPRPTATSRPR